MVPQKTQAELAQENAARQKMTLDKECKESLAAKRAEFERLNAARDYWAASTVIRQCANVLNDADLKSLIADAEGQSYQQDLNDPNANEDGINRAADWLKEHFPDKIKEIDSKLPELLAQAEKRKKAEGPKRIGTVATSAIKEPWRYSEEVDKMTSKTTKFAHLSSINSLGLSFPYSGSNYGRLMVRKYPASGSDVMVSIDKGQILCTSYSGCSVRVRFGDREPVTFQGVAPADHSSDSVFLRGEQRFIDNAKKVKSIKVELPLYQSGNQVLEFDSNDTLAW